jgi:hypothetical protein
MDPPAVCHLGAQGKMQEADFCTNQGDDFVSGFHGRARLTFWVDRFGKFWLPFFGISSMNSQVRLKSKPFFSTFRMSNDMQIWIDRHGVGISKDGAQLRQISDLFFLNPQPASRLSDLIDRQGVG